MAPKHSQTEVICAHLIYSPPHNGSMARGRMGDNLFQRTDQDGAQVWHEKLDSTKVAKPFALGSLA